MGVLEVSYFQTSIQLLPPMFTANQLTSVRSSSSSSIISTVGCSFDPLSAFEEAGPKISL